MAPSDLVAQRELTHGPIDWIQDECGKDSWRPHQGIAYCYESPRRVDQVLLRVFAGGDAADSDAAEEVLTLFQLDNERVVQSFLEDEPHLIPLLREAHNRLSRVFGRSARLALQVMEDPDAEPATGLLLLIRTRLSGAEARLLLRRFESEWWLHAIADARGRLTVLLDYE